MNTKEIARRALLNNKPVYFQGRSIGPGDVDRLRSTEGLTVDDAIERILTTGGRDAR